MTKSLISFAVILFTSPLFGQIDPPKDIKTFLCHKWGVVGSIVGGEEFKPAVINITYQFYADSTFLKVNDENEQRGTWTYHEQTKLLFFVTKREIAYYVNFVKADEIILSTTEHPMSTKMRLRVMP